jgi:chromosome segregation ATPase
MVAKANGDSTPFLANHRELNGGRASPTALATPPVSPKYESHQDRIAARAALRDKLKKTRPPPPPTPPDDADLDGEPDELDLVKRIKILVEEGVGVAGRAINRFETAEQAKARLEGELEAKVAQLTGIGDAVRTLEKEITTAKEERDRVRKELDTTKDKVDAAEKENKKLGDEVTGAKAAKAKVDEELVGIKAKLAEAQDAKTKVEGDLGGKLKDAAAAKDKLEKQLKDITDAKTKTDKELTAANNAKIVAEKALKAGAEARATVEKELQEAKTENQVLKGYLSKQDDELDDYVKVVDDLEKKAAVANRDIEILKRKVAKLEGKLKRAEEVIDQGSKRFSNIKVK